MILSAVASQGFDSSGPIGALTPVGEGGTVASAIGAISDEESRKIWLDVDGVKRQDSILGEMVWSVPEMIARLSEVRVVSVRVTSTARRLFSPPVVVQPNEWSVGVDLECM